MNDDPEQQTDESRELAIAQKLEKMPIAMDDQRGYIVPTNIDEAYRFAQAVVVGRLAPDSYNNDASKVMLGVMAALEAGLPPLYGLRQIAIIQGRPTVWGDALMALIQNSGQLENHIVREIGQGLDTDSTPREQWPDDYGFEVRMFRKGQAEPYVGRFTVGDAKRAKLWMNTKKVPWFEHPKRMLRIAAHREPIKDGFADCTSGLAMREEVEDTYGVEKPEVDTSFLDDTPAPVEAAGGPPAIEGPVTPAEPDAQPSEAEAQPAGANGPLL